jgi:hypothetical protein
VDTFGYNKHSTRRINFAVAAVMAHAQVCELGAVARTDDLPLSLVGRYFLPMWWTVWWIPFILTSPLMLGLLVEAIWGSRNPGVAWIAVGMGYGLIAAFFGSRRRH